MFSNFKKDDPQYNRIGTDVENDSLDGCGRNPDGSKFSNQRFRHFLWEYFWIITTIFLGLYSTILSGMLWCFLTTRNYEHGFSTDLDPARSSIELVHHKFSGGLMLYGNGSWYREDDTSLPQYVGKPSRALDQTWSELLTGTTIYLTGDEAESVKGKTYQLPDTDFHLTGVNVFHSLHCLNLLRKALSPDYYVRPFSNSGVKFFKDVHIDHCVDFIRQSLQCSADLSPMLWYWSNDQDNPVLKSETVHTCRSWDAIHEWAKERAVDS